MTHLYTHTDDQLVMYKRFPVGYPVGNPVAGNWQIPVLKGFNSSTIPGDLIAFDDRKRSSNPRNSGIHFYRDDRKFASVLKNPLTVAEPFEQIRLAGAPKSLWMYIGLVLSLGVNVKSKNILWALLAVTVALPIWSFIQGGMPVEGGTINQKSMQATVQKLVEADERIWLRSKEDSLAIANEPNSPITKKFKEDLAAVWGTEEADRIFKVSVDQLKEEGSNTLDYRVDEMHYVIQRWDGATEKDGIVTAKFFGWPEITNQGHTGHRCETNWTVLLKRSGPEGEYRLVNKWGEDLDSACHS